MTVAEALERLLSRLQPVSPVDAGLAEAGLMIEHPIEALVIRALALEGALGATDLAAFVAASPRPRGVRGGLRNVRSATRRLRTRGLVEGPDAGPFRLVDRLAGRVAHFPRLIGPAPGAPALDLPAGMAALAVSGGGLDGRRVSEALGGAAADWADVFQAIGPGGRALADRIGGAIFDPPLRCTLDHGMERVRGLAERAVGIAPDAPRAFAATWGTFVDALGRVVEPALLDGAPDRREELLRRWAWFVGCPVAPDGLDAGPEPPLISAAALVRLDWRRILADTRALEVMQAAEDAAEEVLSAERARRAAAARAYASGRRE